VKLLWEAGVPTEDIDPDLLHRYLCGEDLPNGERREGDIGNTELIFKRQLERARASGQAKSILLNMGSLVATIEMERNGMFVNKALGLELAAALERVDRCLENSPEDCVDERSAVACDFKAARAGAMTHEDAFFLDVEKAFEERDAFGRGELTFDGRLEGFARVLFEGFEVIGHRDLVAGGACWGSDLAGHRLTHAGVEFGLF
jgi:hypothetical protein